MSRKLSPAKIAALRAVAEGKVTFWGISVRGDLSPWSAPRDVRANTLYALDDAGLITRGGLFDSLQRRREVRLTESGREALEAAS